MNRFVSLFGAGLLCLGLAGCATSGRPYDDSKFAMLKRGQTTEAELLAWFGPPESRNTSPDGRMALSWSFARKSFGGTTDTGTLQVKLDPDGKVDVYSARKGSK